MTNRFYKEKDGSWYIDLQPLLDNGTFTKANLQLVAGADTLLDLLSNNGKEITIQFEEKRFKGWEGRLKGVGISMDKEFLESIGHPVQYGGDYICTQLFGKKFHHPLWLCEVTSFLFEGVFPPNIYIRIIKT